MHLAAVGVLLILSGEFGIRGENELHLAFLSPDSVLGSEWESAFEVSVELINELAQANNFSVKGTTLKTSNCSGSALVPRLLNGAAHGVVGPAYSDCAVSLSKGLGSNLTLLSYAASADTLSNKTTNPNFFRVCPGDQQQAKALANVVQHFWGSTANYISVIGDEGEYSSGLTEKFVKDVKALGADLRTYIVHSSDDVATVIRQIRNSSSKVTVVLTKGTFAEKLFLEAKKERLISKGHYWIAGDSVAVLDVDGSSNLREALDGVLVTAPKGGGSTSSLYFSLLSRWLSKSRPLYPGIIWNSKIDVEVSPYVPQIYDAVLTYYQAYKDSLLNGRDKAKIREELAKQLQSMKDVSTAVNGSLGVPVFFDADSSSGPVVYSVLNWQGDRWEKIGLYEENNLSMYRPVIWSGQNLDINYSTPSEEDEEFKDLAVVLGIILAIFVLLCIGLYQFYHNSKSEVDSGEVEKPGPSQDLIHRNSGAYEHSSFADLPSTYFDEERKIEVTHL